MVTSWKKGKKSNCRDRKQRSQEQWSVRLFIVDDEWKFDLDNKIKKKKNFIKFMTGWTGYVDLSKSSTTRSNNTGTGKDSLFRLNFNTEAMSHP